MAKKFEFDKFLIIECTANELMNAVGSDICICDWCGKPYPPSDIGYYIAVLNQLYCKECFAEWCEYATWYPSDAGYELKNFEFYAPRFGIKCQ